MRQDTASKQARLDEMLHEIHRRRADNQIGTADRWTPERLGWKGYFGKLVVSLTLDEDHTWVLSRPTDFNGKYEEVYLGNALNTGPDEAKAVAVEVMLTEARTILEALRDETLEEDK